jgi:glucose 1-dehydrogenase
MAVTATSRSIARNLIGQKALVTGADSGIGRAVAVALGQAGADVVVNYVRQEGAAAEVVKQIESSGVSAYAHKADVAREDEVEAMFAAMLAQFGTIDILVANAGLQRDAPFHAMTLEQWNTVLGVNLTGQFLCAREALREFLRRGVVEAVSCAAGKIICMSSVHQEIPWAGHANYAASKAGVMMMMRSLAQEVAPHRIRVNGIAGSGPNANQHRRLANPGSLCRPDAARAIPTHRRARGYRTCGGLARLRRFRLCGRDHPVRRWRNDSVSRFRERRLMAGEPRG